MAWVDLSRAIVEGISVYPGDPLFQTRPFADHGTDGFRGTELTLGSHLGTHIDVPFHYFIDGETLDSFPVDFFLGDAAIIDLTSLVGVDSARFAARQTGRPATVTADDLAPFERIFETVPFIFLRTGWSSRFGASDFYTDFPSLSPETCDWLDDFPKLRILGLETPSLVSFPHIGGDDVPAEKRPNPFNKEFSDLLPKTEPECKKALRLADMTAPYEPLDELELNADAECHRLLLGRRPQILILEGLTNLEALPAYTPDDAVSGVAAFEPAKTLDAACLPLPIAGVDGSPARVVARTKPPVLKVVG